MLEPTLLDLSRQELSGFLNKHGEPRFRTDQIWYAVYRDLVSSYAEITTLPLPLRKAFTEELPLNPLAPIDRIASEDGITRKVLFRLADGETIEAVLMCYLRRRTVCLSTQVGCPIGCSFCATGKDGFIRDLTVGEIVGQALHFARELKEAGDRPTNIVYMGMGEPFLNYEATMKSIQILNDHDGFSLRARAFTVSTVGIAPGIKRFTEENLQVNLAISLHAGNDALRNELVPINRHYPLADLIRACYAYTKRTHRRITFEVALIDGVNDSLGQAREIAALLSGLLCHVNLIPLNPVPGLLLRPSPRERVEAFADELKKVEIPTTVRLGRGIKIQAGCGQLRERSGRGAYREDHSLSRPR